ncbi:MAG: hypothetical protein DCF22_00990 [Leptolyngbya sp.]|nr:MAG: hypothetical protein DCF22_00990 [Leptolyngbya sp.]
MGWVKRAKFGLVAANVLIGAIAPVAKSATPAPGDVVVEIKIEPPIERFPKGFSFGDASRTFHESQPYFQPPTPVLGSPKPDQSPLSPSYYPSFNSEQLDRQLQRYASYLTQFGKPDILIVGSSRALQGVDPIALQYALTKRGYPNLKVFNFGINGATAQVVDWLLRQLLTAEQLPRLIVWADGARAFNSGRIDHTFNNIRASLGYQFNAKIRSPNRPIHGLEVGQICMDALPLQLISPLKFLSNKPRQMPLSAIKNTLCHQPAKVTIRAEMPSTLSMQPAITFEALGFQAVNTQFNPDTYFQRFPRVSGYYDADYRGFTLAGRQINALERVVSFAKNRRIPLVFVNLPLTQTYLDRARFTYENQFRREMRRFDRSQRFRFKDLGLQLGLDANRYFADPSHLNRHGAAVVAMQISTDLAHSLSGVIQQSSVKPDLAQPDLARSRTHSLVQCEKGCLYLPRIFAGFSKNSLDIALHP